MAGRMIIKIKFKVDISDYQEEVVQDGDIRGL